MSLSVSLCMYLSLSLFLAKSFTSNAKNADLQWGPPRGPLPLFDR